MSQRELKMAKQKEIKNSEPTEVDSELQNIVEAALYSSSEPVGIRKLIAMFPDDAQPSKVDIQNVLLNLENKYEHSGVELRRVGKGWRFQTKEKYSNWLRKLKMQKPPRYSRALLETLAIIAYRQPVTRSDIEEIRGVGVSSETIRTLEEREWVAQIGHRDVPGRPALFGTTQGFLEYFNMASLRELPELMEKRELGAIAVDMNLSLPMDGVQGEEDAAKEAQTENDDQGSSNENQGAEVIALHPDVETPSDEVKANDSDDLTKNENDSEQESEPPKQND